MLKGIVIVAVGHPIYGRYAYNLAASIKSISEVPIAILYKGAALSHISNRSFFDYEIEIDAGENCGAKLCVYKYSPFDQTLLLDADMVWLPGKDPEELFAELKGIPFTGITEGCSNTPAGHYFFWGDLEEIRSVYKVDRVFQWRTEVLYFEKGKIAKKIFADALRIYNNPKLKEVKKFGSGVPDELAVNIAAAISLQEPHKERWQPSYWCALMRGKTKQLSDIVNEYWLLSVGGNNALPNEQLLYNKLMKTVCYKLGISHIFPLQNKAEILPERRKN